MTTVPRAAWPTLTRMELLGLSAFFAVWRSVLFGWGYVADRLLLYQPTYAYALSVLPFYSLPRWFYSWAGFDGLHYMHIAESGYVGTALIQAFFPVFPLTVWAADSWFHNTITSGVFMANMFGFLAMLTWYYFLKAEYNQRVAAIGVAIVWLFPTAFFWGALYTESLFFWLVLMSFLLARRRWWWAAGLVAGVASATRIVGVLLVPALLLELFWQWLEMHHQTIQVKHLQQLPVQIWHWLKSEWWQVLGISTGMIGLVWYMVFLNHAFGDPLYFIHVQSEFGAGRQESIVLYPQTIWRYLKITLTYRPFGLKYYALMQEFLVGVVGLILLLVSVVKVRPAYVFFALASFIVPTLSGSFLSMPRFILICFPIFMIAAEWLAARKWTTVGYLTVSVVWLLFNTLLFIQGYWIA